MIATLPTTARAVTIIAGETVSPSSNADHTSVSTGWALQLPNLRDAADREPAVPREEAEEHADERDVREAEPGVRAAARGVCGDSHVRRPEPPHAAPFLDLKTAGATRARRPRPLALRTR